MDDTKRPLAAAAPLDPPTKSGATDEARELTEDVKPAAHELTEDVEPIPGMAQVTEVEKDRERTRKSIAYVLIAFLGLLVVTGCLGWILWGDDTARMQNFSVIFSPVVTLLAGLLGFYFSSEKR